MSSRLAPRPASPVHRMRFSAARKPPVRRALVALGAVGHGGGVGGQQRARHAGGVEDAGAQQLREAAAGALLQDVRQDAKILVDVGIAGARRRNAACACRQSRGRPRCRRTAPRPASRAASPPPSSRAGRTGCGTGAARLAPAAPAFGRRARTSASSTDGSGKASSTAAQVNCLVIEHMRNSVRGVKAMRRSALAQPQAWRTSTSPSRSTATAPPGPG